MKYLLEIAVFNAAAALIAAKSGADRIELCENSYEGGTTPSYGTLKTIIEKINIPVFPIIRPRGGDFLYNEDEYDIMQKDVILCKELGFKGVVLGLLNADGSVDTERVKRLIELAYPLEVTFHRAFDRTHNPFTALENIIQCGCHRILTSGQVPNAFDGRQLIKELVLQANNRIVIMPGSGVRGGNIAALIPATGARELHSSARKMHSSTMQFKTDSMEENLQYPSVDVEEILLMKREMSTNDA